MKPPDRRPLKGTLSWTDGKDMHITVGIDRLAVDRGYLSLLGCVGYVNEIKALRAALAVGSSSMMSLKGADQPSLVAMKGNVRTCLSTAYALPGRKYNSESHRLGFNVLHALFIARKPGLMLEDTDVALWHELTRPRYTTPLLKGWLPYLRQELTQAGKLVHLECVDCDCMGLTATTKDLDDIVEYGLKNGHLAITKEDAA